jgi:hypothetical protein
VPQRLANVRLAGKAKPQNSRLRMRSEPVPLLSKQFGVGRVKDYVAMDFAHPAQKIRHLARRGRNDRNELRDYLITFHDLDLFALGQLGFNIFK